MRNYALFILLAIVSACNSGSDNDNANISLLSTQDYYVSQQGQVTLYLKINSLKNNIEGFVFADSGKAFVTRYPFITKKTKTLDLYFKTEDSLKILKNISLNLNDTSIVISFQQEGSSQIELAFYRERVVDVPEANQRYQEEVFDSVQVETVTYGQAGGYYCSKVIQDITEENYPSILKEVGEGLIDNILMDELQLQMDIYLPVGDTCSSRPLMMLFHGGAFMIGDKGSPTVKEMANYFVRKGYVVAAPNYRLGFIFLPGCYYNLERCIYRATQDARAAIRYLVNYQSRFGIDTSAIFTAGNSAGGFLALNTAMLTDNSYYSYSRAYPEYLLDDLGCPDCSGNKYKQKFSIKGVVSMWGALTHIRMLADHPNIPVLCFHGTDDKIISPDYDYPFAGINREFSSFFTQKFFGSVILSKFAMVTKTPLEVVLFKGFGHDPHMNEDGTFNANMDTIETRMTSFLYPLIVSPAGEIAGPDQLSHNDNKPVYMSTGESKGQSFWQVTGGKICGNTNQGNAVSVVWFRNNCVKNVSCNSLQKNGIVSHKEFKVHVR